MITGGSSRPIAGHFRVEHRWRSSVESPAGPFLLARSLWTAPGSVVILLRDRDAASARLFETAAQIAAVTDSTLAVLCAPRWRGGRDGAMDTERAATHPVRVQVEVAPMEPAALSERLDQLDCRVIALDAGLVEGGGGGLRTLSSASPATCSWCLEFNVRRMRVAANA